MRACWGCQETASIESQRPSGCGCEPRKWPTSLCVVSCPPATLRAFFFGAGRGERKTQPITRPGHGSREVLTSSGGLEHRSGGLNLSLSLLLGFPESTGLLVIRKADGGKGGFEVLFRFLFRDGL